MPTRERAHVPIRCDACDGKGGEEYDYCPVPNCSGPESPEGCAHAQIGWEPCEVCKGSGSGVAPCAICTEEPAVMITVDGEPACLTCGLEAEGQVNMFAGSVAA